jgi:4-amino-4-deoxy-L-arabinose transferase-like glycosyltransferase
MKKQLAYFSSFLLLLVITKLVYWLFTAPNPDEGYYWLWGQYPALSYHDHPGLQAWTQGLFYSVFGKSLFVLRLPAFICSTIIAFLYFKILKKLHCKSDIKIIVLTIFSLPLLFLFTSFAWHDYLLITFCLSSGYFWINYFTSILDGKNGTTRDVFLGCFFIGLAVLCKYNAVFVALGVLSTVVFNKPLHRVFKDYRIYAGILLFLAIISPIFIWNLQNGNGSFKFNLQQRTLAPLLEGRFRGNIFGFLIGSLALLTPTIWWAIFKSKLGLVNPQNGIVGNSYSVIYQKVAKNIFLCSSLTFLFLSTFSVVLYYWNILAYLFLLPLVVLFLQEQKPKVLLFTLCYSAFINTCVVIHFAILPLNSFLSKVEDRDGAFHYGWDKIDKTITQNIDTIPQKVQLFTTSYRTAGLLAFQLNRNDVYSYSERFDQFDYWTKDRKYNSKVALILADDNERVNPELQDVVANITVIDTIPIEKMGYTIKKYYLFKGEIKNKYLTSNSQ